MIPSEGIVCDGANCIVRTDRIPTVGSDRDKDYACSEPVVGVTVIEEPPFSIRT